MRHKRRSFEVLLVLIVFCVYAAGSLFLCTIGANTYRQVTANMQANYDLRTGVLYLAEKTRQNDVAGGVRVERYNGVDALVLTRQLADRSLETWIFVHEGKLCEVSIAAGTIDQLSVVLLQPIMPMQAMKLTLDSKNLLSITLQTTGGESSSIVLSLSSVRPSSMSLSSSGLSSRGLSGSLYGSSAGLSSMGSSVGLAGLSSGSLFGFVFAADIAAASRGGS